MSNEFNKEYDVSPIEHDPEKPIFDEEKKAAKVSVRSRNSSTSSLGLSIKTPRAARFAEATSVNSPIGPTTAGRSPFADPPRTQHLMPQPQPSDVGFGYVSDNMPSKHASYAGVEMPPTPASPLKSALRVPGTPGRLNPLSPTFREEEELEKHEVKAEKENAKDLVGKLAPQSRKCIANGRTESESPSPSGKDSSPRCQLQLQSHRPRHALIYLRYLQRYPQSSPKRRFSSMGSSTKNMASNHSPLHCLCIPRYVHGYNICVLPWRSQTSRESCSLLYCLRNRLLLLQHHHVGSWRRDFERE